MLKKTLSLITLSLAILAVPSLATADPYGHYENRAVSVREWVPARTTRVQVRVWVPATTTYIHQTQIVRHGFYSVDHYGRRIYNQPLTRVVRVPRHVPGCYRLEWRLQTVPGFYRNVRRNRRVFVPGRRRVVVTTPRITTRSIQREVSRTNRRVGRDVSRSNRRVGREVSRTNRRVNRDVRRSASKTGREVRRAGRRINKEIKRLFD